MRLGGKGQEASLCNVDEAATVLSSARTSFSIPVLKHGKLVSVGRKPWGGMPYNSSMALQGLVMVKEKTFEVRPCAPSTRSLG